MSVVVDRGRGSTTTIALEVMKELFGVEESLKILAVAMNVAVRAREWVIGIDWAKRNWNSDMVL